MSTSSAERAARRIMKDWFCTIHNDWHRDVCERAVAAIIREELARDSHAAECWKLRHYGNNCTCAQTKGEGKQ